MAGNEDEAAVKIQAIYRGNKVHHRLLSHCNNSLSHRCKSSLKKVIDSSLSMQGRDKAVQELEALMEAELEYAVTKAQASQGKAKRKDSLDM